MAAPKSSDRFVLPETRAIAALGLVDLVATVYLIATNQAHEANPLLNAVLVAFGPIGFIVVKAISLIVPLAIAEAARKRSPVFVRRALQVAVVLYAVAILLAYRNYIAHIVAAAR